MTIQLRASALFTLLPCLLVGCLTPPTTVTTAPPAVPPSPTVQPTRTPLPSHTPVPTPMPGGLFVDPARDLGPISPYVFGSNYGPWLAIPPYAFELLPEAGLKFMRWPGGSWGDQNEVTKLQIDQFVATAQRFGWEPMFNVRLEDGTPEKAAAHVEYANLTKGYNIRYWAIGNEPNLFVGDYDVERFNREWREWATAMRAVDPSIRLIGPEISQFYAHPDSEYEQGFTDWMVAFLKANGDLVDVVSFHRYPFPANFTSGPPSIAELRENSREWEELIPYLRSLIRQHTGRDLPIAVTEVNSSYTRNNGGEATMDSHFNAIWWADVQGRLIKHGVDIVAQWDLAREYGIVGQFDVHPMFYTYAMYAKFGQSRVYASSDDPYVSVYAARRDDGALTILIINLQSESADKTLRLPGVAATAAETWLFDPEHAAQKIEPIQVGESVALRLPPESLTLLVVP